MCSKTGCHPRIHKSHRSRSSNVCGIKEISPNLMSLQQARFVHGCVLPKSNHSCFHGHVPFLWSDWSDSIPCTRIGMMMDDPCISDIRNMSKKWPNIIPKNMCIYVHLRTTWVLVPPNILKHTPICLFLLAQQCLNSEPTNQPTVHRHLSSMSPASMRWVLLQYQLEFPSPLRPCQTVWPSQPASKKVVTGWGLIQLRPYKITIHTKAGPKNGKLLQFLSSTNRFTWSGASPPGNQKRLLPRRDDSVTRSLVVFKGRKADISAWCKPLELFKDDFSNLTFTCCVWWNIPLNIFRYLVATRDSVQAFFHLTRVPRAAGDSKCNGPRSFPPLLPPHKLNRLPRQTLLHPCAEFQWQKTWLGFFCCTHCEKSFSF